jgi:predicted permease
MIGRLQSLASVLFHRMSFERQMSDEMRFHIEAYAEDLAASGVPHDEALRRARLAFGAIESLKEESRAARGLRLFDELRQDLRFALRQMTRAPGVTVAVVASLALGIGANTAIFSLLDSVVFRMLPLADPARLHFLGHSDGSRVSMSSNYPLFERYKASDVFDGVTAYTRQELSVATADGIERVNGQFVSGNYHAVLGVPMGYGRGFVSEPDREVGSSMIAVISDGYWSRRYGRSPDVLGKQIVVNGQAVSIVGVTRAGFDGLMPGYKVDVTLPLSVRALGNRGFFDAREDWISLSLVGRLNAGTSASRALAVVAPLFTQYWMESENAWVRGTGTSRRAAVLVPAGRGSDELRRQFAMPLRILMAMVGLVLIIACANVANLLLARGATRVTEVAVRMSIGAGRGRLIRQLLTESALVAFAGGALGLVVAITGAKFIAALLASGQRAVVVDVRLSWLVLLFTLVVSLATGIGFGLVPALRATRVDLTPAVKAGSAGGIAKRGSVTGQMLIVAQIALCALILTTAGLLTRTLRNLRSLDAGVNHQNVLLFNLETPRAFSSQARQVFYDDLQRQLHALPGVTAVSYSLRTPVDGSMNIRKLDVPGAQADQRSGVSAIVATPEYFDLFGIQLVRGRHLAREDQPTSEPVAVINDVLARQYFGGVNPIGRSLLLGENKERLMIVGVVESTREKLRDAPAPMVYTALAQMPASDGGISWHVTVALGTTGHPLALAPIVRQEVRSLSRDAAFGNVRTMEHQVDAGLIRERLLASVSAGFALLAILLAAVGLYGLMSYRFARRRREIGLRMALGATRAAVLWRVLGETVGLSAIGIVVGLGAALLTTRAVSGFLFGLSAQDPLTFAAVATILLAIGVASGYVPSRRAAAVDPMQSLRAE